MNRDLDDVRGLKADAKISTAEEDWEGAVADLRAAIDIAGRLVPEASVRLRADLYSELADCYGMIGGVERRRALASESVERASHLHAAVRAYDQGFEYEEQLQGDEASTYNRINRLSTRVLLDPTVLEGRVGAEMDVLGELSAAEAILSRQVSSVRPRDPWAYCDLGTVRLLSGSPDALSTLQNIERLRAPRFVYESALGTLRPLAAAASTLRPDLASAVSMLERSRLSAPES
jgi:hypothetical protein